MPVLSTSVLPFLVCQEPHFDYVGDRLCRMSRLLCIFHFWLLSSGSTQQLTMFMKFPSTSWFFAGFPIIVLGVTSSLTMQWTIISLFLFHLLGLHRVPLSKDVTGVPHINSHWTPVLSKFKVLLSSPTWTVLIYWINKRLHNFSCRIARHGVCYIGCNKLWWTTSTY